MPPLISFGIETLEAFEHQPQFRAARPQGVIEVNNVRRSKIAASRGTRRALSQNSAVAYNFVTASGAPSKGSQTLEILSDRSRPRVRPYRARARDVRQFRPWDTARIVCMFGRCVARATSDTLHY